MVMPPAGIYVDLVRIGTISICNIHRVAAGVTDVHETLAIRRPIHGEGFFVEKGPHGTTGQLDEAKPIGGGWRSGYPDLGSVTGKSRVAVCSGMGRILALGEVLRIAGTHSFHPHIVGAVFIGEEHNPFAVGRDRGANFVSGIIGELREGSAIQRVSGLRWPTEYEPRDGD